MLDLTGEKLKRLRPRKSAALSPPKRPKSQNVVTQPNPATGGWRLSFEIPVGEKVPVELRAMLMQDNEAVSEVWVYRWAP